jgi:hypothetical protein
MEDSMGKQTREYKVGRWLERNGQIGKITKAIPIVTYKYVIRWSDGLESITTPMFSDKVTLKRPKSHLKGNKND